MLKGLARGLRTSSLIGERPRPLRVRIRHVGAKRALISGLGVVSLALCLAVFSTPTFAATASRTYEWGSSVGGGDTELSPQLVAMSGETAIHAGNESDLAIMPNGTVEGWGATEVSKASMRPIRMAKLKHVVQVAAGDHSFVAVEAPTGVRAGHCPTDTSVWVWGTNIENDLGLDSTTSKFKVPVDLRSLDGLGVVQVAAASWHMFALTCTGHVYVWGSNTSDDLGMGPGSDQPVPVENPYLTSLTGGTSDGVMLDSGSFAADILVKGRAYGWGNNGQLQCGCGATDGTVGYPTAVIQRVPFTSISSGGDFEYNGHSLALDSSGRVWCWGDNSSGQCGLGSTHTVGTPTLVPGLPQVTEVGAGGEQSLFLDSSGNVWSSGNNEFGQGGDGTDSNELHVVKVLSGITMISAGAAHSLAAS
jgi:alpha-tubulin suppressor-like RCC1 family protein